MSAIHRLEAHVHGRVHGVGFRHFARTHARRLGLVGWVRNEPDGTVRLAAEGPRADLDALLAVLRRGPFAARVTGVDAVWPPAAGTDEGFVVRF